MSTQPVPCPFCQTLCQVPLQAGYLGECPGCGCAIIGAPVPGPGPAPARPRSTLPHDLEPCLQGPAMMDMAKHLFGHVPPPKPGELAPWWVSCVVWSSFLSRARIRPGPLGRAPGP